MGNRNMMSQGVMQKGLEWADAHGLQYRISSAVGHTLQNQRTCLARNYVFIKDLWVTSVTQPSHECLVALDVSRTLAQGG